MATGMSLTLCLLALRSSRPEAEYVLWPRIDQKSCFKCILTAGLTPVVIENKIVDDALTTDVEAIESQIRELDASEILCVLSTTSCFAPRHPDNLREIASICQRHDIPHVVNNAYGVQSSKCMHIIEEASRTGRVDLYVQSTDKNFMVPVGGAIIAGFNKDIIANVASTYPGRGSSTPSMDLLITLLHFGKREYKRMLEERKECFSYLKSRMGEVATAFGERVLETKDNKISIGMTLDCLKEFGQETRLGSMLFVRGISGARVVACGADNEKIINGHRFENWCSHCDEYSHSYITAAAGIGVTRAEIDKFIEKLRDALHSLVAEAREEQADSNLFA